MSDPQPATHNSVLLAAQDEPSISCLTVYQNDTASRDDTRSEIKGDDSTHHVSIPLSKTKYLPTCQYQLDSATDLQANSQVLVSRFVRAQRRAQDYCGLSSIAFQRPPPAFCTVRSYYHGAFTARMPRSRHPSGPTNFTCVGHRPSDKRGSEWCFLVNVASYITCRFWHFFGIRFSSTVDFLLAFHSLEATFAANARSKPLSQA